METSKMLHMEGLDSNKTFALFAQSEELKSIAIDFYESLDQALIRNQIIEITSEYDLGTVLDVFEIFGGYVNRSFGIYTEKEGQKLEYFVRKYKKGVTDKEIQFEHALINFSIENGLNIAAKIFLTKDGKSFVKKVIGSEEDKFAIYQYLPGEDKYSWDNPTLTDEEYASVAEVLATFHNTSRNFNPKGLERLEPKIMEFLPTLPRVYQGFAEKDCDTKFHRYYLNNVQEILKVIDRSQIPAEAISKMPFNPCHNDFHPGNLKYIDNKAVGLFDFDWSKIDLRLFDVCLTMAYCCSSWQDQEDGTLRLDKCSIFLNSYQSTVKKLGGIAPLNETEIQYLPTMMAAANIYLINWDVTAYYAGKNLNEYEYIAYLQHNVRLMNWIENNKEAISNLAQTI